MAFSAGDAASTLTRRSFLTLLARLSAVSLAGELLAPRARPAMAASGEGPDAAAWLDLGPAARLTDGRPAAFPYLQPAGTGDGQNVRRGVIYVMAVDGYRLRALSNICPHEGCRVHWDATQQLFVCPCHDASFAADGRALGGLPQAPLAEFPVRIRDGQVQVKVAA